TVSDLGASLAALSLPPPPGLLLTADAPPQVVALSKGGMTLMAASKLKTVIVMAAFLMAVGLPVVGWYVVSSRSAPPRMASTAPAASPVAGALPAAVAPEPFPAVTFDDGTHVRLSNVRRYYQPQRPWAADGSPAMDDIAVIQHGVPDEDKADAAKVLEVRLEFKGELSGKGYALRLGGTYNWTTHNDPAGWPNRLLFSTLFRLPKDEEEAELQIGLAWQPWEDTEVLAVEDAPARALAAAPFRTSGWGRPSTSQPAGTEPMHILSITEEAGKTLVEYTNPHGWPQGDWRGRDKQYMIRTRDGRIVKWRTVNYPDGRMIFVYDLPLSEIEAAVYQTRAYEWKSLGRVKLQAKSE
ncbi:MAG TPA: hypothetical protein VGB55_01160, partial [Tepidisphaeraceae bacterium]